MKYLLIIGFLLGCEFCFAQKKVITESDVDNWPHISGQKISNDGKFVLYTIYTNRHRPVLTIQAVDDSWKMDITGGANPIFNTDSRAMIFRLSSDSLGILNLVTKHINYYLCHGAFAIPSNGKGEWLAYVNKIQDSLILRNLWTDRATAYEGLTQFQFSNDGSSLIAASHKEHVRNRVAMIDLISGKSMTILNGNANYSDFTFDPSGKKIAFVETETINDRTSSSIRYYYAGLDTCKVLASGSQKTKEQGLTTFKQLKFSKDGLKVFFNSLIFPEAHIKQKGASVDVWSYKDTILQSRQANRGAWPQSYLEVVGLNSQKVIRLGDNERDFILLADSGNCNYVVKIQNAINIAGEMNPNIFQKATIYVVSTQDGAQKHIISDLYSTYASGGAYAFNISPEGKYFLWYDPKSKSYNSLNISSGVIKNVSSKINTALYDGEDDHPYMPRAFDDNNTFIWGPKDSFVLINDRYDIWKVDPDGKAAPANLTNGYGRKHHQVFRYVDFDINREFGYGGTISSSDKFFLVAFDTQSKYNGFFSVQYGGDPQKLTMGPYVYYFNSPISSSDVNFFDYPIKAKNAERYLVTRMGPQDYPNLYTTTGFKKMDPITSLSPQSEYNWYSCELIHWKTFDNKESAGILYKPEDFDPAKKYPVIFYYYEKLSDGLYQYLKPELCAGELNIPSYVSNGYLVFVPDIHYSIGSPGENAYNSIVSAASYLSKLPWVDSNKMGLQGHSFGGYETNYIVTKTSRFAAAAPAAGPVDLISDYGSLRGDGESAQWLFEPTQFRIGATLWQNPQSYLSNSPIFNADKVKTPLLIMHNKNDDAVPFDQGIEWFAALRRLDKKAWLLQYDGEGHSLNKKENELDFTIRLRQFFDHYLKNAPAPRWMTQGVGFQDKGIDDGLALDRPGVEP